MPEDELPTASYQISVLREAMRIMSRLDRRTKERIAKAIEEMATNPFAGDVRPLEGEPDAYRRRIGDWRVLFRVDPEAKTVTVYRVGPRGDVYRP